MNNRYSIVIVLLAMLSLITSCMGDNETTVTYYDDAAVTAFTLGTLNRTMHTKSKSGADSTYTTTLAGSKYAFSIDHAKGLIYNVDSLPEGTRTDKSLITVSTRNSGIVYLKSLTSDSISLVSSSDSLDFSVPRTIFVLSNDGSWNRSYKVEIRVHKEKSDQLYWNKKNASSQIAALENMKALNFSGKLMAYGTSNNTVKMYSTAATDGNTWNEVAVPFATMPSIATDGTMLIALADNKVYRSANAAEWETIADGTGLKSIIGASRSEVYALSTDGKIVKSCDQGASWSYDDVDADASMLPQHDVNGIRMPSALNPEIDKMIIVGNRGVASDTTAVVWTKTIDNASPAYSQSWMYQPFDNSTWHHAPLLNHLSVAGYGKGLLMLGSVDKAGSKTASNFGFYYSWDNGLNWWKDKRFALPAEMTSNPASFAIVSDDNTRFWILCGESGEVWQGYYSTWTWE